MQIFSSRYLFTLILVLAIGTSQAEEAPDSVTQLVPTLQQWSTNAVLVKAVQEQNASNLSMDEITKRDADWMAKSGLDDFMKSLMSNAAAEELKKLEQSQPYFLEMFLMDNQGANVAMTNKTSDYWQGDEAKFKNSFNGGTGGVEISDVEFDESSQAYLVQVSIAIMDGDKAIGALTIGINLDELEQ